MTTRLVCKQKGCPLASKGTCLEGVEPPSICPHVVETRDKPKLPASQGVAAAAIPTGGALDFAQATRALRSEPGRVILLAGAQRSGKTTLALAFYELFQKGPFEGFDFAGSETLVAFEQLCHNARVVSENDRPETLRTQLEAGTHFLHLRLRAAGEAGPPHNLYFADLSGEHYENACNSTDECKKLEVLRRADIVVLLLDGGRLIQSSERAKVLKEVRSLLRSAIDAAMIGKQSRLRVCFAKCDLLSQNAKADATIRQIKAAIEKDFGASVDSLAFDEIAARPDRRSAAFPLGFGLAPLLKAATHRPVAPAIPSLEIPLPESDRQIDRFLLAQTPDLCTQEE